MNGKKSQRKEVFCLTQLRAPLPSTQPKGCGNKGGKKKKYNVEWVQK